MNAWMTLRVAVRALLRNKMRSFLTTLGIIIGVFAVIAMVAIGEGAKSRVEDSFSSMGSNMLIVLPGTTTKGGAMGGFGTMPTLTWDDLRALRAEAPAVRSVAAEIRSSVQVQHDEQTWTTTVNGTSPEFFDIRAWKAESGSLLQESDVDGGSKVAVLGRTVVDKLFGAHTDPIGQSIRIKGVPFMVTGVLEKKGQSAMGQDNDDAIYVPQTTYQSKISGGQLQKFIQGVILISARDADSLPRAQSQVAGILRERHHLAPGADDDFSLRNLAEMASAVQDGAAALAALLAAIAAVSLLVGGIGIMNIMLVSVTERTREIGIRMAVGAKGKHILAQFLVEALVLSLAGGVVGIALGLGAANAVAVKFGWPLMVRPDVIGVAVTFSGLVGVVFGLYPAYKASRLDPIDALRYE